MIGKGISADPPIEEIRRVRIFSNRTKVEHPEVLIMAVFEEFFYIFSTITIDAFKARRWVSHYNHSVCDID